MPRPGHGVRLGWGESQGEQAERRNRERDYVWMKLGTLQNSPVFLLFIIALPMGMGLQVSLRPGWAQPSGGGGSIAPPFLGSLKPSLAFK